MISKEKQDRFRDLCKTVLTETTARNAGIGQLNEKSMHLVLKRFICPDELSHEISIRSEEFSGGTGEEKPAARFVADVFAGDCIYEIQTGSLYPLRKKLDYYLSSTEYPIEIVHPVPALKWMSWVQPDTGIVGKRRKSPQKGTAADALSEIYWIREYLSNPRLRIRILFLETEEYRFLDGWDKEKKRGSNRLEMIPVDLLDEILLELPEDYWNLLPKDLPNSFTVSEFSRCTKIRGRAAYRSVYVFCALGLFTKKGKKGRSFVFKKNERGFL